MRMRTAFLALMIPLFTAAHAVNAQEVLKPVKLMTTQEGNMAVERQFYGQVAAKDSVDLAFQVGGQVVLFPVAEGFIVERGKLIAELDLEQFQLQLDQARLQLAQAERTVERLIRLKGTVSQVSIDDAETQAALAAIALRNAEYDLKHASLNAPFDGLVSSREVAIYSTVSAGTPIVRLHDMSELHIEVDVPEILFQRTDGDSGFEITATFPGRDEEFPLRILEFDAEASNVGQTFRVTFALTPPEGFEIYPGSSTTVSVRVNAGHTAITLPPTALVTSPSGDIGAMVFDPTGADEGTVTWTSVEIQPTQNGAFQVLSGLTGGQEVVLAGGNALKDGQAVRRFTGFAN